jgi:hypothetical protein
MGRDHKGRPILIATGYALGTDDVWRMHSWGLSYQEEIIETTSVRRLIYYGYLLEKSEEEDFYYWAMPRR